MLAIISTFSSDVNLWKLEISKYIGVKLVHEFMNYSWQNSKYIDFLMYLYT